VCKLSLTQRERAEALLSEVIGDLEKELDDRLKHHLNRLLDQLNAEKQARIAWLLSKLDEIQQEVGAYKKQQLARLELELKQILLNKLENYIEELVSEAIKKLADLRRNIKKYRAILSYLLHEALQLTGIKEGYVEVAEQDTEIMAQLVKELNSKGYALVIAKTHINTIGGLRLISIDGKLAVNNTLEARVQRAKTDIRAEVYRLVRHGGS
jgi:vacuolar-type H+-ATPase subunit E/Vma4